MFFCDAVDLTDDENDRPDDEIIKNEWPDDPAVVAAAVGRVIPPRPALPGRRTRRRRAHRARAPPDDDDAAADAYSIAEFCRRHAISQSFYFALQASGKGPRTMKLGGRVLISREAAAAWRRQRERAAKKG
jgi:hypothetical protein